MITARLHHDGCRVALTVDELVNAFLDAMATEYAEDPHEVGDGLLTLAQRRGSYQALASLEESADIPDHVIDGAAAALDACRDDLTASLGLSTVTPLTEVDARLLAALLLHHADETTSARIRKGAAS